MSLIFWIIIGGLAGWIAERITKSDHSLLVNIFVGIAGGFIGGFLFELLGISLGGGIVGSLITAVLGALALLYGLQFLRRG